MFAPDRKPAHLGQHSYFYVRQAGGLVEVDKGGELTVDVHIGLADGFMACVGVSVRSFRDPSEDSDLKPIRSTGYVSIGSPEWRSIPIGALIQRSLKQQVAAHRWLLDDVLPGLYSTQPGIEQTTREWHDSLLERAPKRGKRGPRPQLSDQVLRDVVAPAYRSGGSKPVIAVQQALESTGFSSGTVTMNQASKAVVYARRAGYLPPATGRGKP